MDRKRHFKRTRAVFLAGVVWIFSAMAVFAGNINANEQGVLDAAEGTFNYNGKDYVATDAAKERIRSYLMQDGVDLTAEQAAKAVTQAFGNVELGVAQGYLVPADGQDGTAQPGQPPLEEQPADAQTEQQEEERTEGQDPELANGQEPDGASGQEEDAAPSGTDGGDGSSQAPGAPDGAAGETDPSVPRKMTKEEEDALINSLLEKEGLEAEEGNGAAGGQEDVPAEEVGSLPGGINLAAAAGVVAVAVLAAAGAVLYRHKNRFKNR